MTVSPCSRPSAISVSISAGWPQRWTGRIARVRRVIMAATRLVSIRPVSASTSTKTGVAPTWEMASVVAMNVIGTEMTSSPSPTPAARRANVSASVPVLTVAASAAPQNSANSRSRASTSGPPM